MTADEFAQITHRVIQRDGFDDFLPVACFPARRQIRMLKGLPPDVAPEQATIEWASGLAEPDEEYLVAFKVDNERFKIVRFSMGERDEQTYDAHAA